MKKDAGDAETAVISSSAKVILDFLERGIAAHPEQLQPVIAETTLERWRSEGLGPKFLKLCGRVLCRQVDIEAYEESCLATSTRTVATQVSAG
ncbi:hypothetical protein [Castellaniella sp.]|uniref:helix-turn-helix transcriptional regulator n=1 Tax=Castellaniella sp. TaxID=1955812 RepID=UPI003569F81E